MTHGRRLVLVAAVTCAAAVAALVAWPSGPMAQDSRSSKPSRGEVVMIRCDAAALDFAVAAYQGSTSAPGRRAATCPESLSLLMKDGFVVHDIGHYDQQKQGYVVFTLVR